MLQQGKLTRTAFYVVGYVTLFEKISGLTGGTGMGMKLKQFLHWFTLDRILALVAIAAGIVAIYYETELHNSVEKIISALPTRYVSKFPGNLDDARGVISAAERDEELVILTDFLGYAYYSCPSKFDLYSGAIRDAARKNVHVKILIYGRRAAGNVLDTQMTFKDYQTAVQGSDQYKDTKDAPCQAETPSLPQRRFRYFVNANNLEKILETTKPTQAGYERFRQSLHEAQKQFCHELDDKWVQIKSIKETNETPTGQTNFFWMRKDKEVVYAYPNIGIGKGFTFRSNEHSLLSIFFDQFDKLWGEAEPIQCDFFTGALPIPPVSKKIAQAGRPRKLP
jgi:hypothetical protein